MSVKEDDVLRFLSALAVFGVLPSTPPKNDNPLAVVGVMCIVRAADRMLSVPFSDPSMEEIRKALREKLPTAYIGRSVSEALFEQAGSQVALKAGLWISAYVNQIINRAGDEPYTLALELSKGSPFEVSSKEHTHGNA